MSRNMNQFDPFARHRTPESAPKPDQIQPVAAAVQPVVEKPSPVVRNGNPFGRHEAEPKDRPEPARRKSPPPAQELLHWIQRWGKPIVSLRDVRAFGPNATRDRPTALNQIEILVQHGWLVPLPAHRRDRQVWRLPPPGATVLSRG
jgi:hypothetical protein